MNCVEYVLTLSVGDIVGVYVLVIVWTIYVNVYDGVGVTDIDILIVWDIDIIDVLLGDPDIVDVFVIDDVLDIVGVCFVVNEFTTVDDIVGVSLFDLLVVVVPVIVDVPVDVFVELIEFVFDTDPVDVFDFKLLNVFDVDIVFVAVTDELFVTFAVDVIDGVIVTVRLSVFVIFKLLVILLVRVFVFDGIPNPVDVGDVVEVIVFIIVLVGVNVPIFVFVINAVLVIVEEPVDVFVESIDLVFVLVVFILDVWMIEYVDVLDVIPVLESDGLGDDVFELVIVLVPDEELVPVFDEVPVAVPVNVYFIVVVLNDVLDIVGLAELVLDLAADEVKEGLAELVFDIIPLLDNVGDDDGVFDILGLDDVVLVELVVLLEVADDVYVLLDVKLSVCFGDADDVLLVIPDAVTKFVFIGVLEGYEVGVKILLGILVLVNVTVLVDVLDMVDVDVGTTLFIKRFLSLFIKLIDNKKIKNFNITYC